MKKVKFLHIGSWYRTYDDDAKVTSLVTNFRVMYDYHTTRYQLSFPEESLEKVTYNLELNHISYELVNEDCVKDFIDNNYDNFINGNLPYTYYVMGVKHNRKLKGSFEVKYNDEEVNQFIIGENINPSALLVEEAYKHEVGDIFDINGDKILLVSKNIEL